MLESKYYSDFRYSVDFHIPPSIPGLLEKLKKELIFLVMPEDTTDNMEGSENRSITSETSKTRSLFKAMCWVGIAIILSLAIGQLS